MAGKSAKKHAINNTRILNQSIYISIALLTLSLLRILLSNSKTTTLSFTFNFKLFLSQAPLLLCLYILNRTGRPIWLNGELKNEGSMINLSDPKGLVEYMLDIIYLSWIGDLFLILFNSFKLISLIWILLVPSFVFYKLFQLRNMYSGGNSSKSFKFQKQINNNNNSRGSDSTTNGKSKRQLKRENRSNEKIKYRYR